MRKKKDRSPNEINAGSMADIAFLLLIFFLVTTTMDMDKGILIRLPPWSEEDPPDVKVIDRNTFIVLVNARDELLVEGDRAEIGDLKDMAKEFIANPFDRVTLAESPLKAVISLKNDRGTSYDMYIQIQNELKAAYNELRDEEALRRYGIKYAELDKDRMKLIKKAYPQIISEAEPEDAGKQS
ncbi:MAG: biopolymer transporter ExbD [Bacteroidia bacterium]|nr:biopolymer transporter ExbD [Bacteroidia bacterium]